MCIAYNRIVTESPGILHQINPNSQNGLYCPEAADAVHDFLTSGTITPVSINGTMTYPMQLGGLVQRSVAQIAQVLHNCRHRVVRGTRANGATHWFVAMKVNNRVYAVDAMLHVLDPSLANYVQAQGFSRLDMVQGQYDVTPVDPLGDGFDIADAPAGF